MKFYICSTPYHLYVSLCMIMSEDVESYLYLSTPDNNTFTLFEKYKERMNGIYNIKNIYLRKRNNKKERFYIETIKDILEYKNINEQIKNSQVYIFPWHPYSLYTPSEYIFKKAKCVKLVEDGSNAYLKKQPSNLSNFIKKYVYFRNIKFYNDEKISEILVQYPEKYPEHLKDKISLLDLSGIQNKLNLEQKSKLISVFASNLDVSCINSDSTIILTQPLSEDGFVSENEKINMYKEIIDQELKNSIIVIKKHPRERTEYRFENTIELDGSFPSEIFTLLGIEFEKAIGICTSAINSIKAKEAYNIDEKFFEKN